MDGGATIINFEVELPEELHSPPTRGPSVEVRLGKTIYRAQQAVARSLNISIEDAEDAVSEALLEMFEDAPAMAIIIGNDWTKFYRILYSRARQRGIDIIRKHVRDQKLAAEAISPEAPMWHVDRIALEQALETLAPTDRETFSSLMIGESIESAAERLGKSCRTINRQRERLRSQLSSILK